MRLVVRDNNGDEANLSLQQLSEDEVQLVVDLDADSWILGSVMIVDGRLQFQLAAGIVDDRIALDKLGYVKVTKE